MKNLKKDNKGFSLVELIVVVLIMAIIAVALAPQVIKWVNNSRIAADNNTKEAVVAAAQNCLSDEAIYKAIKTRTSGGPLTITVNNSNLTITNNVTGYADKFGEYASVDVSDSDLTTDKFKTKQSGCVITVTIADATAKLNITVSGGEADISDK